MPFLVQSLKSTSTITVGPFGFPSSVAAASGAAPTAATPSAAPSAVPSAAPSAAAMMLAALG